MFSTQKDLYDPSSYSVDIYPEEREVSKPIIISDNGEQVVIGRGSHYIFSHVCQQNNADHKSYGEADTIYKHIILTLDESKIDYKNLNPTRVTTRDIILYKVDRLVTESNKQCLNVIFDNDALEKGCNIDILIGLRKKLNGMGCDGIMDVWGNILLYSENESEIKYTDYNIVYSD